MPTIKEYGKLEKTDICCDLAGLEKYLERNKLETALKITPSGIKANHFVGVIKYKNFQLQVLPKLITEENASEDLILKNLIFMLSYTRKLDIKTTDSVNLSKSQNPFLEILIKEFANLVFYPNNFSQKSKKSRNNYRLFLAFLFSKKLRIA